ncbi:MAG TPA: beta-ketoacyl synthase N-terminal-like domain-containing protein, partial [bacterium]|nr:beta-ketoacyl synthase N-terminal-like domain-containing protein [bacterium]
MDGDAFLESLRRVLEDAGFGRPGKSAFLRGGNAIGIRAIRQAMRNLAEETIECAIVGGVDSHLHRQALQALEKAGRLKTSNHPEGLIPGESAAFVLLERESTAERRREPVLARIRSSGYVSGEATRDSGDPIRGIVLTEAIRKSLRRSDETSPFDLVLCDLNGERVRMMEWALARNRILAGLEIDPPISHPAECWGDLGAASSIALLATGAVGIAEEWIPIRNVLVWSASDDGDRGSITLRAPSRSQDAKMARHAAPGSIRPSLRLWKSHSEEAAYLYEVRHPERAHWQTEWDDLRRWEERLNPHLRALLLGGFECAQFVCERYLNDEDAWPGEQFVAAWVCASVQSIETMQWVAKALEKGGPGRGAIVHALVRSLRPDLEKWIGDFLEDARAGVRLAGIEVVARRAMLQHRPHVEKSADDPDASVAAWAVMAASRWQKSSSWDDVLEKLPEIKDTFVLRRILVELLRRGE